MTYVIAAMTAGGASPSTRFRIRQYIAPLLGKGIAVREFSPGWRGRASYRSTLAMMSNFAAASGRSVLNALESRRCDATLIQRWALSSFPTTEVISGRPRVWDVDDAIWLKLPEAIVRHYAASFDRIICGNSFLAQEIERWNRQVVIIPTAVDTDRFSPAGQDHVGRSICWTGTSSNLKYLYQVEGALATVLVKHPDARLRIVCDLPPTWLNLDPSRVDYVPWSTVSEVAELQTSSMGIMPLDDTVWARGKCSYKMLCYMACGIPVVASPVGMNAEVLRMDDVGLAATSSDEWVDSISCLLNSPTECGRLGRNGRRVAVSRFSLRGLASSLASELKGLF
jgi:glycosyltransferase involved in cell wall biosynthesis